MNSVRLRLHLTCNAFEFIERERCFGTTADSIEALLIERAALLHDLLSLNVTAEQLGIDGEALSVQYARPGDSAMHLRWIEASASQAERIKAHLEGFPSQSDAIEHLVMHVKHLRKATESLRFECARGILNNRIAAAS